MSLQERVAAKQAPQQLEEQPHPIQKVWDRPASDIHYIDLLGFKVAVGPGQMGRVSDEDVVFSWSKRGTLIVHDKKGGDEYEFHSNQFFAHYRKASDVRS